jgi:hypothetical protein
VILFSQRRLSYKFSSNFKIVIGGEEKTLPRSRRLLYVGDAPPSEKTNSRRESGTMRLYESASRVSFVCFLAVLAINNPIYICASRIYTSTESQGNAMSVDQEHGPPLYTQVLGVTF